MSPTVRRSLDLFRVGVGGAAAVVLLAACGGEGGGTDTAAATPPAGQSAGTAAAGTADFCASAGGIDQRVDAALSDAEGDPSVAEAFRAIADDLRGVEAPAAIASDWTALAAGLDRMADAFAEVDISDVNSLEALDRAEGDLTTASDNVDRYLRDECGL
ncbi:hypothetical protein [Geodermatophilus sp. CPCC 206100]|uniref:hypothetical protein n=1 Tax=Geodermatophilus sp. CPCC 206100 TaxID=3020054 RepID=UPI003B000F63